MTWNLWWRFGPWDQRQPAIIRVLAATNPDVVCLQEVWSRHGDDGSVLDDALGELADTLGMYAVRNEPVVHRDESFGNALLSRWPIERIADEALPGQDGASGHRRIVAGRVDSPWGPWTVACTHLDHRFDASAVRQRQVERVLELVADWRGDPATDLPVVVGGDFNAVPDSDEMRTVTGRRAGVPGIVMSDVWEQAGEGPGLTWQRENPYSGASAWPGRRLDYLLVSWPRPKPVGNPIRAWLVGDGPDADGVWPSDHAAVVTELITPEQR